MRAPQPSFSSNPVLLPHHGSTARGIRHEPTRDEKVLLHSSSAQRALMLQALDRHDGTMSKGNTRGGKPRMDPATWLSSFRAESVGPSRVSSGSRPPSGKEGDDSADESKRRRSVSRNRGEDRHRDSETATSLIDE